MYKLKHIPTGLFYIPSTGHGNLSSKGKLYQKEPKIQTDLRIVIHRKEKLNKRHQKIMDVFNLSFPDNGWQGIDKWVTTKESDWEIVNEFQNVTDKMHELTYDSLLNKLPKNIVKLIGEDKIVTTAFNYLKNNPYLGFAYLLGIVHSTRELYDGEQEIAEMLQQYGVLEMNKHVKKELINNNK